VPYEVAGGRYEDMTYGGAGAVACGCRDLAGLWHNFGDDTPYETGRGIVRRAFDLGITHFDLANNYGRPTGARSGTSAGWWPTTSGRIGTSW